MRGKAAGLDLGRAVVDFVYESMGIDAEWSQRQVRGFEWWGHRLRQRVWSDPVRVIDRRKMWKVHCEVDVLDGVKVTPGVEEKLGLLNVLSTHGALVADPKGHRVALRTCAYVHEENLDWIRYRLLSSIPLLLVEAETGGEALAELFSARFAASAHPRSGPRKTPDNMLAIVDDMFAKLGAAENPWSEEELHEVAGTLASAGLQVQKQGEGFLAGDIVTAKPKGRKLSSMQGAAKAGDDVVVLFAHPTKHPKLGQGVVLLLAMPWAFESREEAGLRASHLNAAELEGVWKTPLFGAWCEKDQTVYFASFLAAAEHKPNVLLNECMALILKGRIAWRHGSEELKRKTARGRRPAR